MSCSAPDSASMAHTHLSRIMQALDSSSAVAYMLDSEFRIKYFNTAWKRFAEANGAPKLASQSVIGADLFHLVPEALRPFYSDVFREVMATERVWEKSYECSSPTLFRRFRMRIHLVKPPDLIQQPHPLRVGSIALGLRDSHLHRQRRQVGEALVQVRVD